MDIAIARKAAFAVHDDAFLDVLGSDPRLELVLETDAHEGPVYAADEDALYFTTIPRRGPAGPRVDIRRLALDGTRFPLEAERLRPVLPRRERRETARRSRRTAASWCASRGRARRPRRSRSSSARGGTPRRSSTAGAAGRSTHPTMWLE